MKLSAAAGVLLGCWLAGGAAWADALMHAVPLYDKGLSTYYVAGQIDGYGAVEFMVDTGSAYVILTEETLRALKSQGRARYLRDLSGQMADGSRVTAPVFRIASLRIGEDCEIRDVEATVLRTTRRHVLGLSALRKAAPFTVSLDPPSLALSQCRAGLEY